MFPICRRVRVPCLLASFSPCLPIKAPKPPTGAVWLREIRHDGYRFVAGKDDGEALWKFILVPLLPCFGAF
jgi:hypothetical protein